MAPHTLKGISAPSGFDPHRELISFPLSSQVEWAAGALYDMMNRKLDPLLHR
jgi:hypothetical protein